MGRNVSRKQREVIKAQQAVNIVPEDIINDADKLNLADQCYHNREACMLGTYNTMLSKYAVHYRNRWYVCVYNRDLNKVSSMLTLDMLEAAELVRFQYYKNRLEIELKAEREPNFKKEN